MHILEKKKYLKSIIYLRKPVNKRNFMYIASRRKEITNIRAETDKVKNRKKNREKNK